MRRRNLGTERADTGHLKNQQQREDKLFGHNGDHFPDPQGRQCGAGIWAPRGLILAIWKIKSSENMSFFVMIEVTFPIRKVDSAAPESGHQEG